MALSVARLVSAILSGWRTDPDSKFAPGSTLAPSVGTPATNIEAMAWYEAQAIVEEIETYLDPISGADHAGLTNLAWGSSGHTGTANRLAGFDGAGAAGLVVAGDGLTLSGGSLDLDADVLRDADVGVQVAAFSHNHDASYAPIAKGVTNGDSHDHSGGDGAQISHANLGTLGWSSSGHTGTASRLAGFDGSGNAAYYQIGVDVQAYDADLTGLAGLADGVACRVSGTWTNKTGADERLVRWDGTTGLQSSDVGLTDDSTLAWKESGLIRAYNNGTLKLQAYDLGGSAWADLITLTSGTAGVNLSGTGTTIGGQYPYRVGGTDVSVADGGTGASTAEAARTNLGVLQGMIAKIPSNVTMTNATLASTGCTLTIGAGETWMFLMTFESNVNATDNLKYQLQTTGTAFAGYGGTQNAAITRYTEGSVVVVTQSANPQQYTAIGHILGGASGGTVTLYVAKNGTSGGNGTVYAGGSIVAWKLP